MAGNTSLHHHISKAEQEVAATVRSGMFSMYDATSESDQDDCGESSSDEDMEAQSKRAPSSRTSISATSATNEQTHAEVVGSDNDVDMEMDDEPDEVIKLDMDDAPAVSFKNQSPKPGPRTRPNWAPSRSEMPKETDYLRRLEGKRDEFKPFAPELYGANNAFDWEESTRRILSMEFSTAKFRELQELADERAGITRWEGRIVARCGMPVDQHGRMIIPKKKMAKLTAKGKRRGRLKKQAVEDEGVKELMDKAYGKAECDYRRRGRRKKRAVEHDLTTVRVV